MMDKLEHDLINSLIAVWHKKAITRRMEASKPKKYYGPVTIFVKSFDSKKAVVTIKKSHERDDVNKFLSSNEIALQIWKDLELQLVKLIRVTVIYEAGIKQAIADYEKPWLWKIELTQKDI